MMNDTYRTMMKQQTLSPQAKQEFYRNFKLFLVRP